MLKKTLPILFIILSGMCAKAQELPLFNQYMHNMYLLNPAMAGSRDFITFTASDRHQWMGFKNSPNVQVLSITSPMRNSGLGLCLYSDNNGATIRRGAKLSYAYHIPLGNYSGGEQPRLSFGLSFTGYQMRINKDMLSPLVDNDPLLMSNLRQGFYPNAEAGMYLYNSNYFFGFSASRIINSTYLIGESNLDLYIIPTHFFAMAGFRKDINNHIAIEPFMVAKANTELDKQIDLNLKTIIGENYWAGLSFRMNVDNMPIKAQSISFMGGLLFLEQFRFSYTYEYTLTSIRTLQWGTHELTLTYEIPRKYKNKRKTRGKRGSVPCPAYGRPHSYR